MKKTLSVLCLPVLLAGCGDDGVSPGDADTILVLTTVSEQPVPASFLVGRANQTFIADTIWLTPDDEWLRHQVYRIAHDDGSVDDVDFYEEGWITQDGNTLTLEFECNDVIIGQMATCIGPAQLEYVGDRWQSSWFGGAMDSFAPLLQFEELPRN